MQLLKKGINPRDVYNVTTVLFHNMMWYVISKKWQAKWILRVKGKNKQKSCKDLQGKINQLIYFKNTTFSSPIGTNLSLQLHQALQSFKSDR